jgi:hypothetical protein
VEVPQLSPEDLNLEQVVVLVIANFATVAPSFNMDSFLEEFFSGIEKVNGVRAYVWHNALTNYYSCELAINCPQAHWSSVL